MKIRNDSNINSASKTSVEKDDISRAERFTTNNKKKISFGNFDSNNILMNNLSRLSLDRNDFKGAKSFIEKLNVIDKENKDENKEDTLLKEDLEKNVFSKNKKKITFDKIRDKLENKDKFEKPKLFYDLYS